MLEAILVGIIDAFLLRKTMHFCSGVDSADPRTAAIAEIARIAGFTDPDRFADLYTAAYGETPSATLRRAGES
jgi:AraC-like DNA-binding protein